MRDRGAATVSLVALALGFIAVLLSGSAVIFFVINVSALKKGTDSQLELAKSIKDDTNSRLKFTKSLDALTEALQKK